MHITDGVLSTQTLIISSAVSAVFLIASIRSTKEHELPQIALFSALFFIASFIHIPVGISSAHLILSGLIGASIGFGCFLAIFVALFLQALLFGFGGLSSLLSNTLVMALPAYLLYLGNSLIFKKSFGTLRIVLDFAIGSLSTLFSALLLSLLLYTSNDALAPAAISILIAHIPLSIVEGIITAAGMSFYRRIALSASIA
ncbi:cobalt transporter CbiM [Campylobacter sp. 19-13652]|uniref:cobalt transporter CbiM n=1 Tax=Campylobacter sp. 19-13652 TaxID=2840180 RepID=UPI001C745EF4|nr:cobalt transporter CbiM [Campylobacter sp. 19-13652]BCX79673.1 cobalt transporter CbiM [Campylobacter sp. 19-13652]